MPISCLPRQLHQHARRSLWTSITTTGKTIQECIQAAHVPKDTAACIALVSKSFPDYRDVTRLLSTKSNAATVLGCVVDHVPNVKHGISLWMADSDEKIACFHIPDGPERHKVRSISVGRWGNYDRLKYQGAATDWDAFDTVSRPANQYQLPVSLQTAQAQWGRPSFCFVASDHEPDNLLQTLDHHFPETTKVGIIGASTPFITGHPYALFYKGQPVLNAGIVGLASFQSQQPTSLDVEHPALEPLGQPLTITRCRGNIILDLDQAGATGLLLALIQQGHHANIAKDQEFYLGIYGPDSTTTLMSVCRVTSGDPARGNMSIDTTADLQVGQVVQFMKKKSSPYKHLSAEKNPVFGVVDKDHTLDMSPVKLPEHPKSLLGAFGGASENGIIVGKPNIPSQIVNVPYSTAKLT